MLCSKADIQRRISLGYAAFNKYRKAWNTKIPLKKRLILYEALVVSVLMYNSSCWEASKAALEKLDSFHRHHLKLSACAERSSRRACPYLLFWFAINSLNMKRRVGRPQSNLFSLIKQDLNKRNLFLNNINDLNYLRNIAYDRASWRRMQQLM